MFYYFVIRYCKLKLLNRRVIVRFIIKLEYKFLITKLIMSDTKYLT